MSIYSNLQVALRNTTLVTLNEYPTAQVIFSHQNGTEPEGSYVTVSILDQNQQGRHTTSTQVNTDGELTIQTFDEIVCQFSFVGDDSGSMAYSFNQRINNNPLALEEAARNNLGVMRKSRVRRAPQKRDTQWVEYHNIDVTFSYNVVTNQIVDTIEGITVEGNYETIGGVVIEDDFTIPPDLVITP